MVEDPGSRPDRPRIVSIEESRKETDIVTTLFFNDPEGGSPGNVGQFLMVWVPNIDEIPMSLTKVGTAKAIAVHRKGEATSALHDLRAGDRIGIRGPYGNGFDIQDVKSVLVVAGGTGIAPIVPLIEAGGPRFTVVLGARTASEILYKRRLSDMAVDPIITTDDGSAGKKGLATEVALGLIDPKKFDLVLTCGPEIMMLKLARMCKEKGIRIQCSTERYMKCGIGICDSCSLGGVQICKDGPIIEGTELLEIPEFGKWRRGPSGRRERF